MKTIFVQSVFISLMGFGALGAMASGSYSCCFKKADGTQYTYRGRASTYFRGTIDRLCKAVALESDVKQCDAEAEMDEADFEFVTKPALPEEIDLSANCKAYPCNIGLYFPSTVTGVFASSHGQSSCNIAWDIHGSGIEEHTLTITLGSLEDYRFKTEGGCEIIAVGASGVVGRTRLETKIDRSNLAEYLKRAEELKKKRGDNQ